MKLHLSTRILWVALGVLIGCGDDGGGSGDGGASPTPSSTDKLTVQESIDLEEFDALLGEDADLAALAEGLTVESAGILEDTSGKRLTWGEAVTATGGRRTLIQACDGDCISVVQTISGGATSWEDASGASVTPWVVGKPVLLKDLIGHDLKNGSTLTQMGGLSTAMGGLQLDSANPPVTDFQTRRFVALNTFGDVFGLSMSTITDAVKSHGGFDEIVEIPYAREESVTIALEELDAHDAMVWLAQGVREERKANWTQSRTVGLTVNRGGYGEAMMSRDALAEAGDFNVSGGPGLVFLAASQSYSDGSEGQPDEGSIWTRLQDGDRIVVGLEGHADVDRILLAAKAFFDIYMAGNTSLADALTAGTNQLEGTGARLVSSATDESVTWLRRFDDIWDGLGFEAKSGQLIVPITAIPYCGQPGGQRSPKLESYTQPFINEITYDGAYLEGTRQVEFSEYNVDVTMRAMLTGVEKNDRIYVEVFGDFDKEYREYHAWCEGVIRDTNLLENGGKELQFNGPCHTIEYTDDLGQVCVLNNPQMSTTTSVMATLELVP
ncbi:MAG: hypothetical protein CL940_11715 [Deltaproteobacteria bacterium]|nr:hypothetical protein [Deltaproteobacteria bacterium]